MGWMRLERTVESKAVQPADRLAEQLIKTSLDATVEFVEDAHTPAESYSPVPGSLPDDELPFIPASIVSASATSGRHWIVIDNIVYDVTSYITEHPGGQEVMKPFRGHDCTWQFHRFHGKQELQQGRELRVGRTSGVRNKFKERPRFVGLRPWGADYL
jgi:cytochrome b involved in lipid metabolism